MKRHTFTCPAGRALVADWGDRVTLLYDGAAPRTSDELRRAFNAELRRRGLSSVPRRRIRAGEVVIDPRRKTTTAPRSATPEKRVGRKPLLHMRVKSAWPFAPLGKLGVKTTKAGRMSLSLPRP